MRRINIRQAVGDPVLALPLVDERGAFVLAAGKALTSTVAERVWERGFRHAYVEYAGFEDIHIAEPLQPRTYSQLRRLLTDVVTEIRETRPSEPLTLPFEQLDELVVTACDELAALAGEPFVLYAPWEGRLDEWLSFAINAAVLAGLLGLQRRIEDARHLFMAALMQDAGLWRADRAQDHVTATTELLRPLRDLSPIVKKVAVEHHELLDGTGYPSGKAADELHSLTRVMNVVVAYLTMIGSKTNRVLPHEALEGLLAGAGETYDVDVVQQFRRTVPAYPPGTVVRLSDGRRGVVLESGPEAWSGPLVRLLSSSAGRVGGISKDDLSADEANNEYPELSLASELAVTIAGVLD